VTKLSRFGTLVIVFLIVIIVVSSAVAWSKYHPGQPVEISLASLTEPQLDRIYAGGAVNVPGFYPLDAGDTIEDIIQAAGGTTVSNGDSQISVYVSSAEEESQPQKVNLNRAEAWLLEALPGIGPSSAQEIINYRHHNGPFSNIAQVCGVKGIGEATY
jgi:competence protein ComEA